VIPGWLKSLVAWLAGLFFHEAVEQVKEEIKQPSTITDEKTPDKLRAGFSDFVGDRLRERGDSSKQ